MSKRKFKRVKQRLYRRVDHPKTLVTKEYAEANPTLVEVVEVERRRPQTRKGGGELRRLREELGIERGDVARVWGKSRQRLATVETSGRPVEVSTFDAIKSAILRLASERKEEVKRRARAYDRHVDENAPLIEGE